MSGSVGEEAFRGPVLGYAGTSGHSGGATSEERARREDSDGTTTRRQKEVIDWLGTTRTFGMTWREFSAITGMHHGQASGALSNLHKAGKIARLTERRNRCFVYVLPEYVESRETQEHGHRGRSKSVLTDSEQAQVDGARRSLESQIRGTGSVTLVSWRAEQLLDIIERLTS